MSKTTGSADCAPSNVIAFPQPQNRLRADVPPFDPTNPAHLRAWETIWDIGRSELRWNERKRADLELLDKT